MTTEILQTLEEIKKKLSDNDSPKISSKQELAAYMKSGKAKINPLIKAGDIKTHYDNSGKQFWLKYEINKYMESL